MSTHSLPCHFQLPSKSYSFTSFLSIHLLPSSLHHCHHSIQAGVTFSNTGQLPTQLQRLSWQISTPSSEQQLKSSFQDANSCYALTENPAVVFCCVQNEDKNLHRNHKALWGLSIASLYNFISRYLLLYSLRSNQMCLSVLHAWLNCPYHKTFLYTSWTGKFFSVLPV